MCGKVVQSSALRYAIVDGPEPTTVLYGQHFTIMEVGHLVDNFTHPLPESLLDILYLAHASIGVDASVLRGNQTYQGGGHALRQLMQARRSA